MAKYSPPRRGGEYARPKTSAAFLCLFHCAFCGFFLTDVDSVSQLIQVFIIQPKKVRDLVDDGCFDLFLDFSFRAAILFNRLLENLNTVRIQRRSDTALGYRRAFI